MWGYHMDYQCTQSEEIERQREYERLEIAREKSMQEFTDTFKEFLERLNIQRKEEEKLIFEEAARQEEEKRIAKEKEAAELEAKCKIQECLNIKEKSIPQASILLVRMICSSSGADTSRTVQWRLDQAEQDTCTGRVSVREPMADETENVESVPTHSNDPLLSGEDSLKLKELMELCTNLQKKVLNLETTKTIQALEIDSLKRRGKKLKKKQKSRTHKLKILYKVGLSAKAISSNDKASLGDQEDASKQGRKILDIDVDKDITLDSTHFDIDPDTFRVHDLHGDEVFVETQEPVVNAVTTTSTIPVSAATATTTTVDELTLAQTLIEIKAAKPKVRGVMIQELTELEEVERLTRQKEEEANIALIESWDNTQAMMDADRLLAEILQAREQEELTDKEKARLFVELLEKRKKHFVALRAQEKRNKTPTKAQKKSTMLTYLKHMGRESPKKDEAEMAQDSSSKRAGDELEQEKAKKQKIDDDQEETKLKELMEVISDEEGVAIDVIPLSTKPPSIVDYKIIKEGKISIYQIIRADGSSKRYSVVIHMLKDFDREDLETHEK
ncbi:hypothetical protein Tco_1154374 [Tanacetum coccineum]